jgi:NAD(P)-dependent dehydrogenase (short-subunit alcohol dehydrogenase family)
MELAQRTALVTGAGSGIGRAIALELARAGATVVCCGRRQERLDCTAEQITDGGGKAAAIAADVTDSAQVARLVQQSVDRCGAIDVLFNNAGSFASIAGVHEVDPDAWWHDVTVNLLGPLLLIRAILPAMIERDSGAIINMNGGRPVGGTGYACGKAGLMELTRILHDELRMQDSNVLVFGAGPSLVRTEMTELQAQTEAGRRWIPSTYESFQSGRLRQPEEIARATVSALRVATLADSGKSYGPDTDFSDWGGPANPRG